MEILEVLRAGEVFEEVLEMLNDKERMVKRKAVEILRKAINCEESEESGVKKSPKKVSKG